MMGKTHIAMGVAAGLAVCQPASWGECVAAVLGGATGGVLCDIECRSKRRAGDPLRTRLIVVALFLLLLPLDLFFRLGVCRSALEQTVTAWLAGGAVLLLTCGMGRYSEHRTFTHSFLYAALVALGAGLFCPMLGLPVFIGALSHMALDMLNKLPLQWLYPFKWRFCLNLCRANGFANKTFMWLGLGADAFLLCWSAFTNQLI